MSKETGDSVSRIFSNPFYCIEIHPMLSEKHDLLVSEEDWIKVGVKLIDELGSEKYLRNLLENLKGNYIDNEQKK